MTNLSTPEPPPTATTGPAIWMLVVCDMLDRHEAGVAKYGTPLQADNGRDPLVDAYQEALDLAVYLRQEIERRRMARPFIARAAGISFDPDQPPPALGRLVRGVTG